MRKRWLQIDVMGAESQNENLIRCKMFVDGRCYLCWITKEGYEDMLLDKVFIRDGKEKDSADVINTTNVFYEKV
ncbi:MAG: hypothetical protein EGP82_10765 [Odoribacter splanchnicus]|nr:hypothetical protein [Odoribacter splanchnicus]